MKEVREFICRYIAWLTSHDDIELEPMIEFEVIRCMFDTYDEYYEWWRSNQE